MATKYYAMIDGEQKGPFSLEELPAAGVHPDTYVWCKGMPDWQLAEDNPDICRLFRNHLYDKMHPDVSQVFKSEEEYQKYKLQQPTQEKPSRPRSRFDAFLQNGESLPTLEEMDSQENTSVPPMSMIGYAWLVTIFCFFPTGIAALVYAYKSKKAWKTGQNVLAHDYNRSAKMWTGITFFIGLIAYALFCAFSL